MQTQPKVAVTEMLLTPIARSAVRTFPSLHPFARWAAHYVRAWRALELKRPPEVALITALTSNGCDIHAPALRHLAEATERRLVNDLTLDRIGVHRDIGRAIFAQSTALYCGEGLPPYLRRYTYPPVISIALNSHCNAACFFCRGSDYKGTSIEFDNIFKLRNAIANARTIDLTGWGEPFFYPRFEEVVDYITMANDTPHLIQVTTNGSFLSARWGKMLSGKISRVVISINAATADTYATQMRYKNQRFTLDDTIARIKEFQRELTAEDRKRFILHMVANTGNFREIGKLTELASELDVRQVSVGNFICADPSHLDKTLWNVKDEYNSALKQARDIGSKLGVTVHGREFYLPSSAIRGADTCVAPFEQFFIEMQGTTAPCCFMGRERMGNIYEDGFEAIWFSDLMNKLRHTRFMAPCQVCTIFTPFDNKAAHISAFLLTNEKEVQTKGGPRLKPKEDLSGRPPLGGPG
jgi:MoaA/NifB/PqqE/SkfB family radical SAM enzyme